MNNNEMIDHVYMYGYNYVTTTRAVMFCDHQSINDFKRLRKADRKEMLDFLRCDPSYTKLYNHIINNIF